MKCLHTAGAWGKERGQETQALERAQSSNLRPQNLIEVRKKLL
jgi:hypothetical protein